MPWTRDDLAAQAAKELRDGFYVNLGIGQLDKDAVHTPGIYVDRIVQGAAYEKRIERETTRQRETA